MKDLYRKVIMAKYTPMKSEGVFPADLFTLVKIILNPNPRLRPSCNTLLNQDIIQKGLAMSGLVNPQCNFEDQLSVVSQDPNQLSQFNQQSLLNTIKLTPKLHLLNKRLPKSCYEDKSTLQKTGANILTPRVHTNKL